VTDLPRDLHVALDRLEWASVLRGYSPAQDGRPKCPTCGGLKPGDNDLPDSAAIFASYGQHIGHRPGCSLRALLDRAVAELGPVPERRILGMTEAEWKDSYVRWALTEEPR
jgi:hypothetical protein